MNKLTLRLLAIVAVIALLMTAAVGCGNKKKDDKKDTSTKPVDLTDCTVTVITEAGQKLEGVGVGVYADEKQNDIIDFARTDVDGIATLKATIPTGSFIILSDLPDGYAAENYYTVEKKDTVITLKASLGSEFTPISLGSVMFDFTVTDQNGTDHTLSNLLESKKAVVINLWYTTCAPCKMEFPFLQQAYNEYKDDVALLAITPMDEADAIAAFATENGLTIPMAPCEAEWNDWMVANSYGYPTTIVIDRFGVVSFIHSGSVDNSKIFKNMFAHFTADDYVSGTIADINQFASNNNDATLGTAENPYEYNGKTGFSVDVEPAQTVYYSLYGVNGLNLSVDSSSLKLVCNETEYLPSDGKIAFTIRSADATIPVLMQFTNTGKDKATYKVKLSSPAGATDNPITMKDGDVTVKLEENNSLGVYYEYKAPNEGTFTLECKNTVNYTVTIKNLDGTGTATLDKNTKKASIEVLKNNKIQVVVTAVEKDGKYPATEAKLNASFKKAETPVTPPTGGGSTTLNTNGKLSNPDAPIEFAGAKALDFSVDVKAGEMVLVHLFRVSGTTLRIADASAYVVYLDKTYTPDKNGYVYVPVTSDSPNNPIIIKIGNGGKANKTYAAKCSYPEGSMMNPYDAATGNIKTQLAAGNDQGLYYSCTAETDGKVTITLKSVTKNVKCDIRVTVVDSNYIPQQYLLSETADNKTLTIDVYAGDEIEINVVALPDENFKYPAATIEFSLTLP